MHAPVCALHASVCDAPTLSCWFASLSHGEAETLIRGIKAVAIDRAVSALKCTE